MGTPVELKQAQKDPPEGFRSLLHQTVDALERAHVAAEMLAKHGVIRSLTYDLMMNALAEALCSASAIEQKLQKPATTIFPSESMARQFCELRPLEAGRSYGLHVDGAGRTTISIHLLIEYL
jgi:hypothetical protein